MTQPFKVVFTPVGWQVIDTREACDPVAEFGTGPDEYQRAKDEAARLNDEAQWDWDQLSAEDQDELQRYAKEYVAP